MFVGSAAPEFSLLGDMAGRDLDPLLPLRVRVVVGWVGWLVGGWVGGLAGGSKPENRIP